MQDISGVYLPSKVDVAVRLNLEIRYLENALEIWRHISNASQSIRKLACPFVPDQFLTSVACYRCLLSFKSSKTVTSWTT